MIDVLSGDWPISAKYKGERREAAIAMMLRRIPCDGITVLTLTSIVSDDGSPMRKQSSGFVSFQSLLSSSSLPAVLRQMRKRKLIRLSREPRSNHIHDWFDVIVHAGSARDYFFDRLPPRPRSLLSMFPLSLLDQIASA